MPSRRTQWVVASALAGWAAARLAGADRLQFAETWTVPLLSFTPQVTAAAWASALLLPAAGPAATAAAAGTALTVAVAPRGAQDGIYARYPLRGEPPAASPLAARCTAWLDLPSGPSVQLTCVHAVPPKPGGSLARATRWRTELAALPAPGDGPHVLAGDFNATLDHAPFRRLLCRGYADAARQAGQGLSLTWGPRPGRGPALLAIDHILTDRRCAVLATSAHRLPGSDHRALYAELRLPGC